ncbi:MAG: thiamine-phosphate kinase [Candidatus Rokubacteria bacterium]|nr:thiamine-phosphate kinase [Candidatus Rokubacteria bacterium]
MKVAHLGERGLIRRIRELVGSGAPGVRVGIGDDAAVLLLGDNAQLLATTDLLLEDIHFRRRYAEPGDIGWKALARNLSDIAAMGGTPRFALVSLACPAETTTEAIDAFYRGIQAAAAPHGVVIVGGDTCASPGGLLVSVTLLGELAGAPRLRSGARPGDSILVTGMLGESAAGLSLLEAITGTGGPSLDKLDQEILDRVSQAHRRPVARVAEGRWLGASPAVSAMIDLSDGLASDLGHLAVESRVGARVHLDRLPISVAVRRVAEELGLDPIELAVTGGEDYELLLTADRAAVGGLAAGLRAATGTPLAVIGEVVEPEAGVQFVNARGESAPLGEGFEHFSPPRSR